MVARQKMIARIAAFLCILLAAPATFASVIFMNKLTTALEEEKGATQVKFDIKQLKKKKKKPEQPKAMKMKQRPRNRGAAKHQIAPLPDLGSGPGGLNIMIPEYQAEDLGASSKDLLDGLNEEMTMTSETVDELPRIKFQEAITYPPRARKMNIEGRVILNLLIDKSGAVEKIKIVEAQPANVFEKAAVDSVRRWRFEPATYKNRPVKVWATLPLDFKLE